MVKKTSIKEKLKDKKKSPKHLLRIIVSSSDSELSGSDTEILSSDNAPQRTSGSDDSLSLLLTIFLTKCFWDFFLSFNFSFMLVFFTISFVLGLVVCLASTPPFIPIFFFSFLRVSCTGFEGLENKFSKLNNYNSSYTGQIPVNWTIFYNKHTSSKQNISYVYSRFPF